MDHISIIGKKKLDAMLEEDEQPRRSHIQYEGYQEVEGFLYSIWSDDRVARSLR